MAKIGRKKNKKMTRLAIMVECMEAYCGACEMLDVVWDQGRGQHVIFCSFFTKELAMAQRKPSTNRAERCADCIMAERCAAGDFMG